MPGESTRLLYLARHAEPEDDGAGLTSSGAQQAEHLGRRLAHLPLGRITHGPLPRAVETALVVAAVRAPGPATRTAPLVATRMGGLPRAVDTSLARRRRPEACARLPGHRPPGRPCHRRARACRGRHHPCVHRRVAGPACPRRPELAMVAPDPVPCRSDGHQVRARGPSDGHGLQRHGPPAGRPSVDRRSLTTCAGERPAVVPTPGHFAARSTACVGSRSTARRCRSTASLLGSTSASAAGRRLPGGPG